jgi:hypothetical protein
MGIRPNVDILSGAFLSVVQDKQNSKRMLVRARRKGDIERVFNTKRISETPAGDYRFRASFPRAVVADAIRAEIMRIDYGNFKSSVHDEDRHDAYLDVWQKMYLWQERHTPRRSKALLSLPSPHQRLPGAN